jgi:hypothetical protein
MKAATVALRDQIMTALGAADKPLSTDQVAGAVGRTHPSRPEGFDAGQVVYKNLRALERQGKCRRVYHEYDVRVFWTPVAQVSTEMNELAAMLKEYDR